MLVFNVTYYAKKGQRDKFLSEIKGHGMDAASKTKKGCLAYDYYFSPDNGIYFSSTRFGKAKKT